MQPLALSAVEAAEIRAEIKFEEKKDNGTLEESSRKVDDALIKLDEKLQKLTRHFLDEVIDEDMYRAAKEEILIEKTGLTQEKNRHVLLFSRLRFSPVFIGFRANCR